MKFAKNVCGLLLLNILKSELPYSNPFSNVIVPNEGWFANFALKLVTMSDRKRKVVSPNNDQILTI